MFKTQIMSGMVYFQILQRVFFIPFLFSWLGLSLMKATFSGLLVLNEIWAVTVNSLKDQLKLPNNLVKWWTLKNWSSTCKNVNSLKRREISDTVSSYETAVSANQKLLQKIVRTVLACPSKLNLKYWLTEVSTLSKVILDKDLNVPEVFDNSKLS